MTTKPGPYFPALDGLRTVCFAWVVFGHGFVFHPLQTFAGRMASMGVRVFFALSGFLITTLLLRELARSGRVDLKAFYTRRALRIFPVYYSALALALVPLALFGDRFGRLVGAQMAELDMPLVTVTHVTFMANWLDQKLPGVLEVLWSISVEEQFYLLFPITFAWSKRPHAALRAIAGGMSIVFVVRFFASQMPGDHITKNTFAIGDHLLLGALAAQFVHSYRDLAEAVVRKVGTLGEALSIGVIVLLCTWNRTAPWEWFFEATLSAIACASLVLFIAVGDGALRRVLAFEPMRKVGQLTYAAYVFHMYGLAIAWAIAARVPLEITGRATLRTALGIAFAIGIALVVRLTFEQRILALKRHFERV